MGIVWEASHKGVPLLGVPGITLDEWIVKLETLPNIHFLNKKKSDSPGTLPETI